MVVDIHLCFMTSKSINPAPVFEFMDEEEGKGGEISSLCSVVPTDLQVMILEAQEKLIWNRM